MSGKIGKIEKKERNKLGGEKMVLNAEQGGPNAEGVVLESEESYEGEE